MTKEPRIAIYPGSFDPVTNGHLDIINRGLSQFDKVVVGVAKDTGKNHLFNLEERFNMLEELLKDTPNVEVAAFSGLTVAFAQKHNASAIIRGLRTVTDFEYEFQMAMMNKRLDNDIETFFLMSGEAVFFIHSQTIKDVISLGGETKGFLPSFIEKKVRERLAPKG